MTEVIAGEVDLGRLGAFLTRAGLCEGPVTAERIGDGHSNLTYRVSDGTRSVVVRRPPPPPLPRGGHDMLREARVVAALHGSGVPVARVLATDAGGEAFGDVPAYVMEHVAGVVVTDATPPALATPATRQAVAEQLVDALAALHAVDWRAAGLEGFGRPEGSNAHLLRRFCALAGGEDGTLPADFAALAAWLQAHVPAEAGATIIHGDFRIGNVMLAPRAPAQILAVLDWELATLGDPLMDVAYFLACYAVPGEPLNPVSELGLATLEEGYPTRAHLAARYAQATGRDLSGLAWYTVLTLFKLAAMYEYARRRQEDEYYRDPALVRRFLAAAQAVADETPDGPRRHPTPSPRGTTTS